MAEQTEHRQPEASQDVEITLAKASDGKSHATVHSQSETATDLDIAPRAAHHKERQSRQQGHRHALRDADCKQAASRTPSPRANPTPPRPAMAPRSLLICSIGNPGASYAHTLHSAGHVLLSSLRSVLAYPAFAKDKSMGNGLLSSPLYPDGADDWTLWQSTSYMNESGKGVKKAWDKWRVSAPPSRGLEGRLVVVHDELEKPLGHITLKDTAGASAKGHNGLKSLLQMLGSTSFVRVGVGIGRPVSRDSDEVARYVLKKMTSTEREKIEGAAEEVLRRLRGL